MGGGQGGSALTLSLSPSSILLSLSLFSLVSAVTDACNGLCDPLTTLPRLHVDPNCSAGGGGPAAIGPLWAPDNQRFVSKGEVDAMGCAVIMGGRVDRVACRREHQQAEMMVEGGPVRVEEGR